jgi:hypothetical protein
VPNLDCRNRDEKDEYFSKQKYERYIRVQRDKSRAFFRFCNRGNKSGKFFLLKSEIILAGV